MSKDCRYYRDMIPKIILGDSDADEQQDLNQHLSECTPCTEERDLYAGTFQQLHLLEDVSVPRHFFVYPEERRSNPWQLFRLMPVAWQGVVAGLLLSLGTLSGIALARLHVRAESGAFILSFGKPAPPAIAPAPVINTSALETRILEAIEEKNRRETLEWVRTLREEMIRSQGRLTRQQSTMLETALASFETRMGNRIESKAQDLQERSDKSVATLYQAISLQRDRDMAVLGNRLNRLAVSEEVKSNQTDAILETLLQVAELRMK